MKIIFFDGVCNLCNRFVDYLIQHNSLDDYKFASLQGETAKEYLASEEIESLKSVVVISQNRIFRESTAALYLLSQVNFLWKIFWVIPAFLRDPIYRFVSSKRYFWFGKREVCRVPSTKEVERFLD